MTPASAACRKTARSAPSIMFLKPNTSDTHYGGGGVVLQRVNALLANSVAEMFHDAAYLPKWGR